jgi:chitodextrinase
MNKLKFGLAAVAGVVGGFLFIVLPQAHAAGISLAQHAFAGGPGNGTTQQTVALKNESSSDLNVVSVTYCMTSSCNTRPTVNISLTDSNGNAYTLAAVTTTQNIYDAIFYAPKIASGNDTITLKASSSVAYLGILSSEWKGVATSSPLDETGVNTAASGATYSVTANASTTAAPELIYAVENDYGSAPTVHTPFTLINSTGGLNDAYLVSSTLTRYTPTWAGSNTFWQALQATFKSASSTADTQPPTVPTNLTVTNISTSTVSLTWATSTDNVGVAGYKIFRNSTQIAATTVTNFTDTSLAASTTYLYTVSAYDAAGNNSAQSSSTSATTLPLPPPAINFFSATPGSILAGQSSTLSWGVTNSTSISINNGVGAVTGTSTTVFSAQTTTYVLTATNVNGSSTAQVTLVVTPDTTPPTVPGNLVALTYSPYQINLTWSSSTDNVGVAGYGVYLNNAEIATVTGLNYQSAGLTPGTLYSYNVLAFDAAGNVSGFSNTAAATTQTLDTTPPSVPTALQSSNVTANSLTLSWAPSTDDTGVAGYQVFRNNAQVATTTVTSFNDAGLTASTTYAYTVTAFDAAGNISAQSTPLNVTTLSGPYVPVYPVKASANGRYLVDQNNVPFMMVGDSPQSMIGDFTVASATIYFADREAQGFNTVWINLLCDSYTFCNSNGTTFDGIAPFTSGTGISSYDLSTPNPAYFARADAIINLAAQYGFTVVLNPIEFAGWYPTLENNGAVKDLAYGAYIGNRYKNFPNIIWQSGHDFETWDTNPTDNADVAAVMAGLASADPDHLQTTHLNYNVSASLDDPLLAPYTTLAGVYTYSPTYAEVINEYNAASGTERMPVFLEETNYEGENNTGQTPSTPEALRRQEYWAVLSGASGQLFGNHYTSQLISGWQQNIATPGAIQFSYLKTFFAPLEWYNLVPDQNHTFVTSGYGTFESSGGMDSTYVTAAITPDGMLGMAYMPATGTISVNMSGFASPVTAQWFDPSNATYTPIAGSPFQNIGSQQFTNTGNDSDGYSDKVLLFESTGPDTQPPTVPTNVSGQAVSASEIDLSWTPSIDNIMVGGYQVFRNGTQIATAVTPSYPDTGVAASTTYTYTVTAFDNSGNISAPSLPAIVTTPAVDTQPPTVPADLIVSNVTPTTATLSWATSTDNVYVAGYQVYRNGAFLASSSATSYIDSTLSPLTGYAYAVDAYDASGNISALSAPVNVTTTAQIVIPNFVQLNYATPSANESSVTVKYTAAQTAGNTNVIAIGWNDATSNITSVTDSAGNAYQVAVPVVRGSGLSQAIYYATNIMASAANANTVTVTFNASVFAADIRIMEYSGLDEVAPFDMGTSGSGNGTTASTGNVTTTLSNDLLVGAGMTSNSFNSAGTGYTLRTITQPDADILEDKLAVNPGAYNATASGVSGQWVMQMAAFRAGQ